MIVVDIALFICIFMLGVGVIGNSRRLDLINEEVEDFIAETRELKQRCDTHKKSIEYLSKSVRELNGVVEAAVRVKEQTSDNKPDTKALIGGWTAEDAEMNWLEDMLAKIRKEKEKPIDATHISVGLIGGQSLVIPVRETGRILIPHEKTVANHWRGRLWTDDDGRIYELPEGCSILGDTSYEMDQ